MSSTAAPPNVIDHNDLVKIVTWFLLVVSILTITTRLLTRWSISHKFELDDFLATCSLICYTGSVVVVSVQAENGLAKTGASLSSSQLRKFSQSGFASDLLFIGTVFLAKLSIAALLRTITPSALHRKLALGLGIFISILSVAEIFSAAFQCHPSNLQAKCFNRVAFWRFFGIMNIITDLLLMAVPVFIVTPLQMKINTKFIILGCFGARVMDIVATSVQLAYTSEFGSSDFTLDIWPWTLIAQVIQCLTLITSCMPYVRPLLKSLSTGLYSSEDATRRGTVAEGYGYSKAKNENFNMRPYPNNSENSQKSQITSKTIDTTTTKTDSIRLSPAQPTKTDCSAQRDNDVNWDDRSEDSQKKILKITTMSTSWE